MPKTVKKAIYRKTAVCSRNEWARENIGTFGAKKDVAETLAFVKRKMKKFQNIEVKLQSNHNNMNKE